MNDPRITAYALNELQGTERDKFESDLAGEPQLQRDLLAACELTDALDAITGKPREGLEAGARDRLLREIAANQRTFRARRKIVRFAVPVSLAAAASIAVLLLISGGRTTQGSAVAVAASGGETAAGERVFVLSDSAKGASGDGQASGRFTNITVPQKRVMPWDAKALGADAGAAP